MTKKICLFTAHSPLGGGGSVIIRSLIQNLPEFSFIWNYLADAVAPGYQAGYWGKGIMGGSFIKDVFQTRRMLLGQPISKIDQVVEKLLQVQCDSYWIISHNEGMRVALELVRRQKDRPVHLTIHDDWAGALCARSFRYRLLAGLAQKLTITTLKEVTHFDVISRGMQLYYLQLSCRNGKVCHRYLPANSLSAAPSFLNNTPELNVGHIGSIYDESDFFQFLSILQDFAAERNLKPMLHMWGSHLQAKDLPDHLSSIVQLHKGLPEEAVVPELSKCAFVYSMYPMSVRLRCFSRTSLPTKLTSYLQAGRPVFGHGPAESTLNEFLKATNTGVMWSCGDRSVGMAAIAEILGLEPGPAAWEHARSMYFGENNLEVMRTYL